MSDFKDISGAEAITKIKELVNKTDICMFCTSLGQAPISTRPMSTQEVDDDGSIWFFSERNSHKDMDVRTDSRVQLFYADTSKSNYLSLYGQAEELKDEQKAKELWEPILKTWFPNGPEDPNLMLIRVRPESGYYWDTKNGKMVAFAKMLVGMVTGKELDDSVEGEVKL